VVQGSAGTGRPVGMSNRLVFGNWLSRVFGHPVPSLKPVANKYYTLRIAILQKMAVAERREAEPTTQHRNEVGLAVRQATIVLLAGSCRQSSCKPINVSCRGHAEPLQPTIRFPEIFGPLARA